jgi:hypothetical protein
VPINKYKVKADDFESQEKELSGLFSLKMLLYLLVVQPDSRIPRVLLCLFLWGRELSYGKRSWALSLVGLGKLFISLSVQWRQYLPHRTIYLLIFNDGWN